MCFKYICFFFLKIEKKEKIIKKKNGKKNEKIKLDFLNVWNFIFLGGCFLQYFFFYLNKKIRHKTKIIDLTILFFIKIVLHINK